METTREFVEALGVRIVEVDDLGKDALIVRTEPRTLLLVDSSISAERRDVALQRALVNLSASFA